MCRCTLEASCSRPCRFLIAPRHGVPVALQPRAFDLLATLIERAGHLVTKDELLDLGSKASM